MDIQNLAEDQKIKIEDKQYEVLNMTKFAEKSSYWLEYKIRRINDGKIFYLNVELDNKAILYEIVSNEKLELKVDMYFQGTNYRLYQSGTEKVETYFGLTDIGLNETARYYEYIAINSPNEYLSIEIWKDETEISHGRAVTVSEIKPV